MMSNPIRRRSGSPLVIALVYDGLCSFEFGCTAEVFGPRPELEPNWYRFEAVAVEPGPMAAFGGLRVEANSDVSRLLAADTIVIPGWRHIDAPVPVPVLEMLATAHARGTRLLSICSGAFVLAAAGLLDGKKAATHWLYADALQARHPAIQVDRNVLYIDEGSILTSAGSAAGLDTCLHLVRRDYGPAVANHVARRLVIPPHRDGGQAQFIERPIPKREKNRLAGVIASMHRNLDRPLSIPVLAQAAAMSERTFIRQFRAATGMAPGEWLIRARLDHARELLETTRLSVESVAEESGFGSATALRHHFRMKLGISPAAYKARFKQTTAEPLEGRMASS